MPDITFTVSTAVASRLNAVGLNKAGIIEVVKAECLSRERNAAAEDNKTAVEDARQALSDAVDAVDEVEIT